MTERAPKQSEIPISPEELQALEGNDGRVWGEIYERYNPKMLKVAQKRVGPDNAEDIVHDVWVKFQTRVLKGGLESDQLTHYLTRSVANSSITHVNREKSIVMRSLEEVFSPINADGVMAPLDVPDHHTNVEAQVVDRIDALDTLNQIPEVYRSTMVAKAMGFPGEIIADLTRANVNTVRTRTRRGREDILDVEKQKKLDSSE